VSLEAVAARRNVRLLSACLALSTTGSVVLVSISALIGYELAEDKSLATLPAALMWIGTALATVPASLIMRRVGRRLGFMIGAVIGMVGAAVGAVAVTQQSFPLLCIAVMMIGGYHGFNYYFRFAGAEVASENYRSQAIALIMAGGVVGGFAGPELSKASNEFFMPTAYFGPFIAIGVVALAVFLVSSLVKIPRPSALQLRGGRPLGEIMRQPIVLTAVLSSMVAYLVMILLMTVTPLAMVQGAHSFNDATFVIQWHVIGMFAPSFFSGRLIRRFGALTVMTWGAIAIITGISAALMGVEMIHFWLSMTLLGLGWNFLFIGSTTLLTEAYSTAERAKTQALNEFIVFGCAGIGSFLSGSLHFYLGWDVLNWVALPPVVAALIAVLWLDRRRRAGYAGVTVAD
jgi:MFS family permease